MTTNMPARNKSSARIRADEIKEYRCKNLIALIEAVATLQRQPLGKGDKPAGLRAAWADVVHDY